MAEDKTRWVQNSYRSSIQINITNEAGRTIQIVFPSFKTDKITGRVISDGFRSVTGEEYELLQSSNAFNKCVKESMLIVYDEMPAAAMSDVDRILALRTELDSYKEKASILEQENAELKAKLEKAEKKLKSEKETKSDKE